MLSVLLLILKIIGIILLVILGLVLLVLFVPICYRGDVHYSDDEFNTHFKVHWLFFPVRFLLSYENDELKQELRIFGFNVLKEKKEKPKDEYEPPLADVSYENELELEAIYGKEKDEELIDLVDGESDFSESEMLDPKFTSVEYPDAEIPDIEKIDTGIKESKWQRIKVKFKRKKKKEEEKPKIPLSRKIKVVAIRTRSKTLSSIAQAVKAAETAMKKIQAIVNEIRKYIEFIQRKSTKRAFKKAMKLVIKVLKHIFPRKIKGRIDFGLAEPHLTGQALGGVAIAYDMFNIDPEDVETFPHFEQEMIDARLEYRGRIFICFLAFNGVKFILDPDTLKTIKFFKK